MRENRRWAEIIEIELNAFVRFDGFVGDFVSFSILIGIKFKFGAEDSIK